MLPQHSKERARRGSWAVHFLTLCSESLMKDKGSHWAVLTLLLLLLLLVPLHGTQLAMLLLPQPTSRLHGWVKGPQPLSHLGRVAAANFMGLPQLVHLTP